MDYNKIIIALVIILVAIAVVGFMILNQTSNTTDNATGSTTTVNDASNITVADTISQDENTGGADGGHSETLADGRVVTVDGNGRIESDEPTLNGYRVDEVNNAINRMY